jgi:hypothetical protein
MIIPNIHGNFNLKEFFIYSACDSIYFDEFGKTLINSIRRNTNHQIHIHLFNPTDEQLSYCDQNSISLTYEYVELDQFEPAAKQWHGEIVDLDKQLLYRRIQTAMEKGNDKSLIERIQKTYFASARYARLTDIIQQPMSFFSMDIDAIVRHPLMELSNDCDFYIRKNKQFLAGGIYFTGTDQSHKFMRRYSKTLRSKLENDNIYWSLDQDILDELVPACNYKELPLSMIDWFMKSDSCVWTAKGKRKDLEIFINEQKKYAI